MSRKKLPKGITWFANDNHDIELFMEQDSILAHNFPIWQHNFEGRTIFTDGELLLMNKNLKRRKLCYGDMLERKASGWSNESLKYVNISENNIMNYFSVVGRSSGKYSIIDSISKHYNKV